jgi:hypothetical protein
MPKHDLHFETFARNTRRSSVEPMVSIQKSGMISLNAAAYKVLKGENRVVKKHPRRKSETDIFVELMFDQGNRMVALRCVSPDNPNSYVLRKQPNSETYLVSAKGFLNHYGIRTTTKGRRFEARMYQPDVLVFSVEKG